MPSEPEVPIQADHVWEWFWELHRKRRPSFSSAPAPILHTDLLAFEKVHGITLDIAEREMILQMDDALQQTWGELLADEREAQKEHRSKVSPKERGAV